MTPHPHDYPARHFDLDPTPTELGGNEMTTHRCPRRGCQRIVPDRLYACRNDWFALSKPTQNLIWDTAHLPVMDPERRAAFRAAEADWEAKPTDHQEAI